MRSQNRLLAMALLVGSSAASLLIFEAAIRLWSPPEVKYPFPAIYRASEDPELVYELKPGYSGTAYGAPLKTNQLGLRNAEVVVPKPAGTIRILVAGDSVTYGYGVRASETFSEQLERRLTEFCDPVGGERFEVVNAGVSGYNAHQELAYLRGRGLAIEPDAVVWMFVHNDVEPPLQVDNDGLLHWGPANYEATLVRQSERFRELPFPFAKWLRSHSQLFSFIEIRYNRLLVALGTPPPSTANVASASPSATAPPSNYNDGLGDDGLIDSYFQTRSHAAAKVWRSIDESLSDTREVLQAHHISLVIAAFSLPGLMAGKMLDLSTTHGLPFEPVAYSMGSTKRYLEQYSLSWDLHPNAVAHAVIARRLYEELRTAKAFPGAERCRPSGDPSDESHTALIREQTTRFEERLAALFDSMQASAVDFKDPLSRQILQGAGYVREFQRTIVLLRNPLGDSELRLQAWFDPARFSRDSIVELHARVDGTPLPANQAPVGDGRVNTTWPISSSVGGQLVEVELSFRPPIESDGSNHGSSDGPLAMQLMSVELAPRPDSKLRDESAAPRAGQEAP